MHVFVQLIFLKDFSNIEKKSVTQDVNDIINALDRELLNISAINIDWANWDDTCSFIDNKNKTFMDANLTNESFINLQLNFMIFIDNNNKILFSKGFNLENQTVENIPIYIIDYILSNPSISTHTSTKSNMHGIVTISDTHIAISSSPIITSLKQGPIKGTLVMGKYINHKFINQLSEITGLSVTLNPLDTTRFPFNSYEEIIVKPLDNNSILGYTVIKDLYENPSFILSIHSSREIYTKALNSRFYFTFFLFISCLILCIVSLKLLDKTVLNRTIEQEVLLNTIPALIYYKDNSLKYITGNELFSSVFNIKKDEIRGKTDFEFFPKEQAEIIREQDFSILSSGIPKLNIERQITLPNGSNIWTSTSKSPYVGQDGKIKGMVGVTIDNTDYKLAEDKIQYLAFYDQLTNLPNRILFNAIVTKSILDLNKNKDRRLLAILYMDLDKFKLINDTLGHATGDEFLQIISSRILKCICGNAVLSRLGGDEFALLIKVNTKDELHTLCKKITEAVKQPWGINGYELSVTISIGIVLYPTDAEDINTLLKCADIAMYRAKEQGRNHYEFYTSTLSTKAEEELSLESSLLNALKNGEFELYYQPQFDAKDKKLVGVEALIRWNHPKLGILPPSKFISYAEDSDLIIPIGEWVIKEACTQAKRWQQNGLHPIPVSVNLSFKQFQQKNLISKISSILKDTGLSSQYLQIEITESMAMQNPEYTLKALHSLKSMGIKIALDDFGTGYSSLSYLKRFPIDKLKIDKSFIKDIGINKEDSEIVKIIISLAHKLNIATIAEGVETEEHLNFLRGENCDEIQGYLLGKPMPLASFKEMLKR